MKNMIIAISGVLALTAAAPASATVYTFSTSVGTGSAGGSITTDDTICSLRGGNIRAFNILINDGTSTFTITNANGRVQISGYGLTATSTGLFFDYNAGGNYALFQNPQIGSGFNYFCLQTTGCYSPGISGMGIRVLGERLNSALTGNLQFATAATVPEPASWALMMLGLGIVGFTMRRRHGKAAMNVRLA